jgi:hypothetical protein
MSEQVVIGLFTLAGTIAGGFLGGFFSVRAAKIGYKKEIMEKDIKDLANQVKSYWLLEKEYLSQIKKLSDKSEDTIMRSTRKIVAEKGHEYPKMTEKEADSILRKYK